MSYRIATEVLGEYEFQRIPVPLEVLMWRAAMRKVVLAPRAPHPLDHGRIRMCSHCGSVPAMHASSVCYQCNSD